MKSTTLDALKKTGRTQYVDMSVLSSWPKTRGTLEFFKLGRPLTVEKLDAEYTRRGLLPAPFALCEADALSHEDFDEKGYVATQWKDKEGHFCYLTFGRWNGERGVDCRRLGSGWNDGWWFAGVPVPGKSSALKHSEKRSDTKRLELLEKRIAAIERILDHHNLKADTV